MASLSKYVLDHDEKTIFVKEEKNGITIFDARKKIPKILNKCRKSVTR